PRWASLRYVVSIRRDSRKGAKGAKEDKVFCSSAAALRLSAGSPTPADTRPAVSAPDSAWPPTGVALSFDRSSLLLFLGALGAFARVVLLSETLGHWNLV